MALTSLNSYGKFEVLICAVKLACLMKAFESIECTIGAEW